MTASTTLRGPSRDAVAELEHQLGRALADVGSRKTAEVGNDLLGLAEMVFGQARLRRTITDVSIDSAAKSALVRGLLEGKVDAITADLVASAAEQRWTRPYDLPLALEELGVETVVRSADDPGRIADELFEVSRLLTEQPELRHALSDPARSVADKVALLRSLLESRVLSATARLVEHAVGTTSHRTVGLAVAAYQRVAAAVQGERVATVRAARELTEAERTRLADALSRQYDRQVHVNVLVDESLIGGLRVEIGDDVIDGSVASRLDDARRRLAG